MRRRTTAGLILGTVAGVLFLKRRPKRAAPSSTEGAADVVNEAFHDAYDAARSSAAVEAPIFVVLADSLVVCRGGRVEELPVLPRDFDVIKAAAHAPVAVYAILCASDERPVARPALRALSGLRASARGALRSLGTRADAVATDIRDVLQRVTWFADSVLAERRVSPETLEGFARECGAVLGRLTDHGTRAQLVALDAAVDRAISRLTADERRALHVVVAGEHQARARSLGMQYFQKRLGEPPGLEQRVTYGERVTTAEEARALVGTVRLDRAVAAAFFGDSKRLQRDVLGDAAAAILATTELGAIE